MISLGSLFDGIGGFPLAAVRHGITPIWASEIEAFPIAVTKIRFPGMVHIGDITKLNGADLPPVDIVAGGSPCQNLSVSRNSFESWIAPWLFLDLRPGHGSLLGALWEPGFPSLIGFSTLATTAWPKDARESFLSAILEVNPHPKYYLTPTACRGILRRAKKRGKELPSVLEAALRRQAEIPPEMLTQWRKAADEAVKDTDLSAGECLTPWDVQSRRIFDENGVWPALYGGEGGGHGYVSTAFCCNQRDEVRDLNGVAGALGAQPGMKQQTFVTIPINTQIATRHESLGEGTGLGIGNDGDPAFTLQAAHSHAVFSSEQNCLNAWDTQQSRIFTEDGVSPTLAGSDGGGGRRPGGLVFASGVVTKGNGDCFLTEEQHTSLTSGGGQAGQGYPCVLTCRFFGGTRRKSRRNRI